MHIELVEVDFNLYYILKEHSLFDILKIKEISILCRQKSKKIRMLLLLKMFWLELFILFVEILSGRYFYCLKVFLAEKSNHQIFLINKPEKRPGKC